MTDHPAEHPWHGYVFAVVCPDALARRAAGGVVRRLRQEGFDLVYGRLVNILPEHLDAAFGADLQAAGETYRYRLLDLVFTHRPSLALVLRDTHGRDDPYADLKRAKGPMDPALAPPGTIRWDFGGINALLGVLHTADSAATSAREAALLVPEAGFNADRAPAGDPRDGTDPRSVRALLALLDSGPAETRDYDDVLAGHRARVIAACFADLSAQGRLAAELAARSGTLARPGAGAAVAAGLSGGRRHPAFELLRADWRPGLPGLAAQDLARRLAALNLAADGWEELVLITSAQFAPRTRAAPPAGLPAPATAAGGMP
jgi:nucleoside diphosphate kinase